MTVSLLRGTSTRRFEPFGTSLSGTLSRELPIEYSIVKTLS